MPRRIRTTGSRRPDLPRPFPITRYHVELPGWPPTAAPLSLVLLSDFHACKPWTNRAMLSGIVEQTNDLKPDLIVLGGDYVVEGRMPSLRVAERDIAAVLGGLRAPMGVVGVLGNHDWKDGVMGPRGERPLIASELEAVGITMLVNQSKRIDIGPEPVFVAGTDSQQPKGVRKPGRDDLQAALNDVPHGAPRLLIAHEPDIFVDANPQHLPPLTLSGHTHAGQLNLFGWKPLTPSAYGGRFAYGHHRIEDRQLIVSSGIGYSGLPMRIGAPAEITQVTITGRR